MNFEKVLKKYRKESFSEREKGKSFERLIREYLLTDPEFTSKLQKVWMWEDFFAKAQFGGADTGIDLVAKTYEGDYWAIQCKFVQEGTLVDKPAVDSFLATSSKEFKSEESETIRFAHRLWVSTTNNWGRNAEEAINHQHPPVTRINLYKLYEAPVDWEKLDKGIHGDESRQSKKKLMPHQTEAVNSTHDYLKKNDRGKLIMACGTGKTYVSLKIAEKETKGKGLILFLVPSIALLSQALREWSAEADEELDAICICSDPKVSTKKTHKIDTDSMSVVDLALPASTDVSNIIRQFKHIEKHPKKGLTVVFSTYQSIDVISKVQKKLVKEGSKYAEFDLIICDEAHRTTGVELSPEEASAFTKVHKNDFLRSKKRVYMTATPRLYSDDSKSKAAEIGAELCSMDDISLYGDEIYRIGFGEAVDKGLLTDYKVLILTLTDQDISPSIQKMVANSESEITSDDATKLVGCINALSKQILGDEGILDSTDPEPMRKAIAFCQTIAVSKKITNTFNEASAPYLSALPANKRDQMVNISSKHIDGTMSAPTRDELMNWLKNEGDSNECHILTNVRCLSEGVDVPSLDAVLFLSPRNSQVDVVQSVGRVMRKSPGKKYGYIVIPVVIPSDIDPNKALDDNKRYKVVWTVLNALRAHDDRFNAIINKIELNKKKPPQILIGRPGYTFEDGEPVSLEGKDRVSEENVKQLTLQFEELQSKVFAKMVQKVGEKKYWEQWARDVASIAERHSERINRLIKENPKYQKAFSKYIIGLQKNINPSITEQEAVEMLSQHIITKPVFEALFEGYSFVKNNPISVSMQKMLYLLESQNLEKDTEVLSKFYKSVKNASGIDNTEGKQRVIIELYDKFFKTAFPKMVEKLGIVYTPVEVVDFIIHSIEDVLKKEFDKSISDKNIQILDPFTGTGTFITRLIQSGLIKGKNLEYKYKNEIYANEIVLLAYYIAAVNIENAYHDVMKEDEYQAFEGICLTDTFQLGEDDGKEKLFSEMFPQNSERVEKQKKAPLRIIMGNPPYSIGQKSANDNAQNQSYEKLDARVAETYGSESKAVLQKALYDAYIKAFRWSTDRLDPDNGGIIAFVSNGAWLDGNSTAGFRKSIEKEFSSIYVFSLRGNARTQGELRRKEAGNVFGGGSRTPIAITLLVKKPNQLQNKKAKIYHHDIGDYLSRKEKLDIISNFKSIGNPKMKFKSIKPNEHGDWINQRNDMYNDLISLYPDKKLSPSSTSFFVISTLGTVTSRDAWVYNYSSERLRANIVSTIDYYNEQRLRCNNKHITEPKRDSKRGSWSRDWLKFLKNNHEIKEQDIEYRASLYRPYVKEFYYFDDDLNQERYQLHKIFPTTHLFNLLICCHGMGGKKGFSTIITDSLIDYNLLEAGAQCFPLCYYEEPSGDKPTLFDEESDAQYIKRDGISDFILQRAHKMYGKNINKEDIFYYVYGLLHSDDYRNLFRNDLKKSLPRIPLVDDVKDFWNFSKAGRKLAELHLNYEDAPPYPDLRVSGRESAYFRVEKMRFIEKNKKDTIIYNSKITISNIPDKAYKYIVNGRSAIEWIMDRYQVNTDKKSGIVNDPNDWADEHNNPSYILDLLLSVINVSVKTVEIVNALPTLKFDE